MTTRYSQMHRTDKYWEHSAIIWPVWPNGRAFVYKLSCCGFESSCSHWNFRFCAYFEQWVPGHSGNYSVWSHSETRTWHDKKIQCKATNSAYINISKSICSFFNITALTLKNHMKRNKAVMKKQVFPAINGESSVSELLQQLYLKVAYWRYCKS